MPKHTDEDLEALAEIIRAKKDRGVAVLTGAGCSISAGIPSANSLIDEIHRRFSAHVKRKITDPALLRDYGTCMRILTDDEREALIKPYLESARINWGHIALACMMQAGFVKRVMTFNFDSVLAQACGLLGMYPATYDFGIAPASDVRFLSEPCIIHLHGQGSGQVMMNTDQQTKDQAEKLTPLFQDTLIQRTLIVIGYSGEADQAFPLLEKFLSEKHRLIWLGFGDDPKAHLKALMSHPYFDYYGGCDSDLFLIALARKLECFPPRIITDPARHLLDEIEPIAPFPSPGTDAQDLLIDLKQRLEIHGGALRQANLGTALASNDLELVMKLPGLSDPLLSWALFNSATRLGQEGKLEAAITAFDDLIARFELAQDLPLQEVVVRAMVNKGAFLSRLNRSVESIAVIDNVISRIGESTSLVMRGQLSMALFNKAVELGVLGKMNEAIDAYDQVVAIFGRATEISIRERVAKSLFNKAVLLGEAKREKEEILIYDDLVVRFEGDTELLLREAVARALVSKAVALWKLGLFQESLTVNDSVVERFDNDVELSIVANVATALVNKGITLDSLKRPEHALAAYDDVLTRIGDSAVPVLRLLASKALLNKGSPLSALGRDDDELAVYESVVSIYGNSNELELRDQVAMALVNKGIALGKRGRFQEGLMAYDEVVARFSGSDDPALKKQINIAFQNKTGEMIANLSNNNDNDKYIEILQGDLEKMERFTGYPEYNYACFYAVSNNEASCREKLNSCKKAGTLPSKAYLLADDDLKRFRRRKWFKELITELGDDELSLIPATALSPAP